MLKKHCSCNFDTLNGYLSTPHFRYYEPQSEQTKITSFYWGFLLLWYISPLLWSMWHKCDLHKLVKLAPFWTLYPYIESFLEMTGCFLSCTWYLVWKKVEEYLRLFETYGGNWFSLFLISGLGKLVSFWGRMVPSMEWIAQKELIILFQMAPSRILCDQ